MSNKANVGRPTQVDIPYASGITGRGVYYENSFNEVTVNPYFNTGASSIVDDLIVATLPTGFRPRYLIEVPLALWSNNNIELGVLVIETNGNVRVLRAGSQTAVIGSTSTITYLTN